MEKLNTTRITSLWAQIWSVLFHPVIIPSLGTAFLIVQSGLLCDISFRYYSSLFSAVFLYTCFIPILCIPLYRLTHIISRVEMPQQEERRIPMIITTVIYIFAYIYIHALPIDPLIKRFVLASVITLIVISLISLKYKISMHMAGMGGLTALVLFMQFFMDKDAQIYVIASIALAGSTGTARLFLNAHKPVQVYAGFAVGFFVTMGTYLM